MRFFFNYSAVLCLVLGLSPDLVGQDACEAGAEEASWHNLTILGLSRHVMLENPE